jgi:hypothetical protein
LRNFSDVLLLQVAPTKQQSDATETLLINKRNQRYASPYGEPAAGEPYGAGDGWPNNPFNHRKTMNGVAV